MVEPRTFVLVGHCGPDNALLRSALTRSVPGAQVIIVNDARALQSHVNRSAVLLVNRILDGGFDSVEGVELIRQLAHRPDAPVMMLISDREDAQQEAVSAGARPGFGKSQVHAATTASLLRDALEVKGQTA